MNSYFDNIQKAVTSISKGLTITFAHFFKPSVTIQYPEQRVVLPERERNRLFVNIDDCIGCDQCSKACPVSCITIDTIKAVPGDIVGKTGVTSQGRKKALFVPTFKIDFAKCCFCGLCVYPCPTDCIYMTDFYEYSVYKRDDLVYEFTDMLPEQAAEKRAKLAEYQEEQARKKEEAAKLAAEEKAKTAAVPEKEPSEKPAQPNIAKDDSNAPKNVGEQSDAEKEKES